MNVFKPFLNSVNGLKLAWAEDHSFRNSLCQSIFFIILATLIAIYTPLAPYEWLILVASQFPIVITETINSSIEAVTDKASPERHPLAKKAKDIGSAAVLVTRLLALTCWGTVLYVHCV